MSKPLDPAIISGLELAAKACRHGDDAMFANVVASVIQISIAEALGKAALAIAVANQTRLAASPKRPA